MVAPDPYPRGMAQQQSRTPGRGKPSPEVYRRRRIVVGVALLVVLALVIWAVIAAVLAVIGKNAVQRGQKKLAAATKDPLPQTRETLGEIPDTVNPSKEIR